MFWELGELIGALDSGLYLGKCKKEFEGRQWAAEDEDEDFEDFDVKTTMRRRMN